MIELIRKFAPQYLMEAKTIAYQVKNVLSKLFLCRTPILGWHTHVCQPCGSSCQIYNSCGDRHCPQCGGARRADWLDKARELVVPGVNYFQVVFTVPDRFSRLFLVNRRVMYRLLFRTAWQALRHELLKQGFDPAALLVLHTWNQESIHHPHIHALVPGGGPSVNRDNDRCWVEAHDPNFPDRREPFLVDIRELGRTFRDRFVRGLGTLLRKDQLRLPDEFSGLRDERVRREWLKSLRKSDWNVFISGPPSGERNPERILKYLTRYLTGGPISDRRIVRQEGDQVTFLARSKDKSLGNPEVERTISGTEFVRRWSLHILPKGFTRTRRFGCFHGSKLRWYLETCRELLGVSAVGEEIVGEQEQATTASGPNCPQCQQQMELWECVPRPSWRDVFQGSRQRAPLVNFPWLPQPTRSRRRQPYEPDG